MRSYLLLVLCFIIVIVLVIPPETRTKIDQGDISFIGLKTDGDDGFALVTFVDLEPETTIYFTDSEWNGTRFGMDESTLFWNSGSELIKAGAIIAFDFLNSEPQVSYGTVTGKMALSRESEAVFAFLGSGSRVPQLFLTAVANDRAGYGTLINTGLKVDESALIYPRGTHFAEYNGKRNNIQKEEAYKSIKSLSNYARHTTRVSESTAVRKLNSAFNNNRFSFRK